MNLKPNKHNINNDNLKQWLDKSDANIKLIANEFILKTTYISYNIFKKYLKKTFLEMLKTLQPSTLQFLILSDNVKVSFENKSGFWVYQHILEYIGKYNHKIITNIKDVDYNLPIIIIDDASYSGSQISSFIELFSNTNCDIYIMIPFISNTAIDVITTTFKESNIEGNLYFPIKNKFIMKPIYELMDTDKIVKLFQYYTKDGLNIREYPIYFDHKVADNYSSFPLIYTFGIIPNAHNKAIITKCKKEKIPIKNFYNELERIPLLNNCQYDIPYDIGTPPCPLQPYKINFIKAESKSSNKTLKISETTTTKQSIKTI